MSDFPDWEFRPPIRSDQGIPSRARRGVIGRRWWSARWIQTLEALSPVSYTHLDVYKRQCWSCGPRRCWPGRRRRRAREQPRGRPPILTAHHRSIWRRPWRNSCPPPRRTGCPRPRSNACSCGCPRAPTVPRRPGQTPGRMVRTGTSAQRTCGSGPWMAWPWMPWQRWSCSVSYTHLDVYKRQGLDLRTQRPLFARSIAGSTSESAGA